MENHLEPMLHHNPSAQGWIEVITGSMFSGKTEELIRRIHRAQIAGIPVEVFKPALDDRFSKLEIVSHAQRRVVAHSVSDAKQILDYVKSTKIVAIDEAQFFDSQLPEICNQLAFEGKRVIVGGLDMDYTGKPFNNMPQLLAMAEFVTKLHAICTDCGQMAQYSHRINPSQQAILLGASENYKPLCRSCYAKVRE